ncbi:cytochrome P450 6k1-like [Battus philenor]|uniref:cytochrome P450 6k1-like n=1 Tax=Battus philenor TaxID=42288 RepID=UPI0035CE875F
MLLITVAVFVATILLWLYMRWLRLKRYWAVLGVPYVPPSPILGNLTFLQRYNSGIWMKQIYNYSKSPYIGIWLFWKPALVVNSLEIGKRILIRDAYVFRDRLVSSGTSDPIGKNNLFTLKGSDWTNLRRRLSAVFTASRLRNMHGLIVMKTKELLQRIDNDMVKNRSVNLRTVFTDYTTDVIGGASLGIVGDVTLTGEGVLRDVTRSFMVYDLLRGLSWVLMFFLPSWVHFFRLNAFPKKSIETLSKIFREALAERGGYERQVTETRDLLDALVKVKQECKKENEDMPEETLIAQAAVFILAGFDTTATVLSWCIFELAFQPEIQETLYIELQELQKGNKSSDTDIADLTNLEYLNAVINETLRKYVPMGWIDRVASQNYEIDSKLTITAGTPVCVNVIGINYDPDIHPDPNRFNPDRFINNPDMNSIPLWTFGDGPRNCIGRRFAYINIRCGIAYIVNQYKFRPLPSTPDPTRVQIEKHGMFYSPGEPILIEFKKRN